MEDLAQIVGAVGDQKYSRANEATMMNIVNRFSADRWRDVFELARRSAVNLMLGNGDAHLKKHRLSLSGWRKSDV